MPMALHPQGLAAAQHRVSVLLSVGVRRHPGSHPLRALREVSRAGGTRSQSNRRHHRQPECEKRRKRRTLHRSARIRRGQAHQGQEAAYPVDTQGLLLHAIVHPADIQDRDGGILLLSTLFGLFPFLKRLFADSAYAGPVFHAALAKIRTQLETEIVRRSDSAKGFVVLPRRWIIERTIAWLNRCRRLAKDWENLNLSGLIFLRLASIRLMLRKLCNP